MLRVNHKQARISGFTYYMPAGTGKKPTLQTFKFVPGLNKIDNDIWDAIWKEVKRAQGLEAYEALYDNFEIIHDDSKGKKDFNPMDLEPKKLLEYIQGEMELENLLKLKSDWKKSRKRNRKVSEALDHKIDEVQTIEKAYQELRG